MPNTARRSDLVEWNPFDGGTEGVLKTPEAKSFLLYEGARVVSQRVGQFSNSWKTIFDVETTFPVVEDLVVNQALERAYKNGDFRTFFLITLKYDRLNLLTERIQRIIPGKPKHDITDSPIPGITMEGERIDEAYKLKKSLVDYVLLPSGRQEEAITQLEQCMEFEAALKVASELNPKRVVKVCQDAEPRLREKDFFWDQKYNGLLERALEFVEKDSQSIQILRQSLIDLDIERKYWGNAIDRLVEWGYKSLEVTKVRRRALEDEFSDIEANIGKEKDPEEVAEKAISWVDRFTREFSEEERTSTKRRFLKILEKSPAQVQTIHLYHKLEDYELAFNQAVKLLENAQKNMEWREQEQSPTLRKIGEFVETNLLDKVGDRAREYVWIVRDQRKKIELTNKLGLVDWLSNEYQSQGRFEEAAQVEISRNLRRDKKTIKDLLIKAKMYDRALDYTEDTEEKIDLLLQEADLSLSGERRVYVSEELEYGVDQLKKAIEKSKIGTDLRRPVQIANSAVKLLVKNRHYVRAISFAKEYGLSVPRLPKGVIEDYERYLDFGNCAIVAEAQGKEREAQVYRRIANYFKS